MNPRRARYLGLIIFGLGAVALLAWAAVVLG